MREIRRRMLLDEHRGSTFAPLVARVIIFGVVVVWIILICLS